MFPISLLTMVKIFVGNLNPSSKALDLRKRFELYGKVTECDIVNNYAFVHMDSEADAEAAIAKLHNSEFDGAKINVELSHGKRSSGGGVMRRRFYDRRYRDDYREDRFRGASRPYPGGPGDPGRDRYGSSAWDDGYHRPYSQPNGPRGEACLLLSFRVDYDYPPNGAPGRHPDRKFERGRGPFRDGPFSSSYRAPEMEPIPPVDYQRRGSPPRGRYEGRESFGDYGRYYDAGGIAQARPEEFYDSYGGANYDYS
ncbi:unnamed protein product [Schistocephalus solidus]|uniref:RRM domain-containing protein n=1 Tax=Schistocephalus solidus TaxID=70667 RepID=A0A3P7EW99_SCHSO|nr:unnamed protein product [Schistocephalus solidus]